MTLMKTFESDIDAIYSLIDLEIPYLKVKGVIDKVITEY